MHVKVALVLAIACIVAVSTRSLGKQGQRGGKRGNHERKDRNRLSVCSFFNKNSQVEVTEACDEGLQCGDFSVDFLIQADEVSVAFCEKNTTVDEAPAEVDSLVEEQDDMTPDMNEKKIKYLVSYS